MDLNDLNDLKMRAKPLIGNNITVIKRVGNSKKLFTYVFENFIVSGIGPVKNIGNSTSKDELSYQAKAILNLKGSNSKITKFPLQLVVNKIIEDKPIYYNYFDENNNTN